MKKVTNKVGTEQVYPYPQNKSKTSTKEGKRRNKKINPIHVHNPHKKDGSQILGDGPFNERTNLTASPAFTASLISQPHQPSPPFTGPHPAPHRLTASPHLSFLFLPEFSFSHR
ncbi:hypothetical protein H6P81_016195 [Aristolochia fimbriata]|uniref:Uncharacterized protein n=1 Tax=Aristolochia fimbriata TaxID=158543 RepID=A0AAV7E7J6_ARIFI|nr:hypothetical protein H6P81_016195 [Aristolochia fimbriata]